MVTLVDRCYKEAVEILKKNSTPYGFKASANYYNSVWARDGAIALLGAVLTKDKALIKTAAQTLETLKKGQTRYGQIPYVYFIDKKQFSHYALDTNLWYIIGVWHYFKATKDKKFLEDYWPSLKKAMINCCHHVIDESGLLDHPEAADWMDSSIGRRGKVFYTNCLYVKALEYIDELSLVMKEKEKFDGVKHVKEKINILLWPEKKGKKYLCMECPDFFDEAIIKWREHYIDYLSFEYFENRCDVWASLLAILFGIANNDKQKKLLKYLERKHISHPYPVKVLWPPAVYPNPTWNPKLDLYREEQHRNLPFAYHNAGIWPVVGGFYILTLMKTGKFKLAKKELKKLAEANKLGKKGEWEFSEWIHGRTGEPKGAAYQSWSAAGYIIAYQAVKGNLIF